jgi:hypothetical protein
MQATFMAGATSTCWFFFKHLAQMNTGQILSPFNIRDKHFRHSYSVLM